MTGDSLKISALKNGTPLVTVSYNGPIDLTLKELMWNECGSIDVKIYTTPVQ
jgi:hypothetical protein